MKYHVEITLVREVEADDVADALAKFRSQVCAMIYTVPISCQPRITGGRVDLKVRHDS